MNSFVYVVLGTTTVMTVMSLYGSVALFRWTQQQELEVTRTEFQLMAETLSVQLIGQFQLAAHQAATIGSAASLSGLNLTRSQWRYLVSVYLTQAENLREINMLRVVPLSKRSVFEAEITQELGHNVTIHDFSSSGLFTPSPVRDMYYPVTFLHPRTDSHDFDLLLDFGSRPDLSDTVRQAIHTNKSIFSVPLQRRQSFAILFPIYRNGELYGLVEMVNSFAKLLSLLVAQNHPTHAGVEIMDCTHAIKTCIPLQRVTDTFFVSDANIHEPFPFSAIRNISFGARSYTLRIFATQAFEDEQSMKAAKVVLAICIVVSLLVPTIMLALLWLKHRRDSYQHSLLKVRQDDEAQSLAAQATAQVKYSFVNYLFHEIRVPLNSTSLALQSVLAEYTQVHDNTRLLQKANITLDHAIVVLNSVLDLEKIRHGKMILDQHWFSIRTVMQECSHMNAHTAQRKGVTLSIDDCLPSTALEFMGDRVRTTQCIMNYVSNAVKYTDKGGHISIRASLTASGQLRVEVEDTGIGIHADQISQLFLEYGQLDDPNHQVGPTTGLGLSIVKSLVDLHNGRCGCESAVGRGSTFWFTLPLPYRTRSHKSHRPGSADAKNRIEMTPRAVVRVLVVDDDPIGREVISEVLKRRDFHVDQRVDGQEVATMSVDELECFDVILMDKTMPKMNGAMATQHLKRRGVSVPVVGLTGNALQPDIEEFLKAGVTACLTKPVNFELLVRTLKETACPQDYS